MLDKGFWENAKRTKRKGDLLKLVDHLIGYVEGSQARQGLNHQLSVEAAASALRGMISYLDDRFLNLGYKPSGCIQELVTALIQEDQGDCRIQVFKNMLYPQFFDEFDKTITPEVWEGLQKEADRLIKDGSQSPHINVLHHWSSIIDGRIPFGYRVSRDDVISAGGAIRTWRVPLRECYTVVCKTCGETLHDSEYDELHHQTVRDAIAGAEANDWLDGYCPDCCQEEEDHENQEDRNNEETGTGTTAESYHEPDLV